MAAFNNHSGLLIICRQIIGLVAASIHALYFKGLSIIANRYVIVGMDDAIFIQVFGFEDMDCHISCRCTVDVITAKHMTRNINRITSCSNRKRLGFLRKGHQVATGCGNFSGIVDSHLYIAIHVGCMIGIAQTTAIGITHDTTC